MSELVKIIAEIALPESFAFKAPKQRIPPRFQTPNDQLLQGNAHGGLPISDLGLKR